MKKQLSLTIFLFSIISFNYGQPLNLLEDSIKKYNYYQPQKAINFLLKAAPLYKQNGDSMNYVMKFNEIAINYYYLNNLEKTLSYLDSTLSISEQYHFSKNTDSYSSIWNIYGVIANRKGNLNEALSYFKKSLAIDTTLEISPEHLASGYNNIGSIYREQGDYQQAIDYYQQAISYQNQTSSSEKLNYLGLYNNIGYSFFKLKNYKKAKEYYALSANYINSSNVKRSDYYKPITNLYNNTALNYQATGDFEKTLLYLNKILRLSNLISEDKARVYKHIGTTLFYQKKYQSALDTLHVALSMRKKLFQSKSHILSASYQAIGDVHVAEKNYSKALENYQKAIQSVVYDFNNDNITVNPKLDKVLSKVDLLKSLTAKAQTLQLQKNNQSALKTYQLCIQLIDQMRNSYQHEESKLFLSGQGMTIYEQAITIAIQLNQKELAFELSEKSKAILLLEVTRGIEARFDLPEEFITQERNYKVNISYYEKQIWKEEQKHDANRRQIKEWQNIIFEVKEKYTLLKEQLKKNYPNYYEQQYSNIVSKVKDVQQRLLNRETAMISYFLGKEVNYIFTITKYDIKIVTIPINDNLSHLVFTLRQFLQQDVALSKPYLTYYSVGHQLYQEFLAPALKSLSKSVQELIIIPDGQLSFIPFEVLLIEKPTFSEARYDIYQTPYLIRDYQISYAYSATLLLEKKKKKKRKGLKPFGGFIPQFKDEIASQRGCNEGVLGSLPFGRKNIFNINKIMNGSLHFDKEATVDNFKRLAVEYEILHLCTHACAGISFKDSRIYFTDKELLAFELYNLPLNAQLAVLSACETGIGAFQRGEGVMSLARAFMYSGCPSVVTSLWSVDDKSTSEIMKHFYTNIKAGMPKNKALHQAKLTYLDGKSIKESHPYYWSAFVQIGDTDALFQKEKINWWWIFSILIIILFAFIFYKKS